MVKGEKMAPAYMTETYSAEQVSELEGVALNYGLAPETVADTLQKYGPGVLTLVIQALRSGFSVAFVLELLRQFGPVVLDFFIGLFKNSKQSMQAQAPNASLAANNESLADFLNDKNAENFAPVLMKLLIEKIIPYIIKNYGEQILQGLLDALNKAFQEKDSARFLSLIAEAAKR